MITTSLNTTIAEAIATANFMLQEGGQFYSHYMHDSYKTFSPDMTKETFHDILREVYAYARVHDIEVKLWRPWGWRFSNAIAMTKGKHIYLNRYKLNRSVASVVGSIFHELVHIADSGNDQMRFGHGNNYRYGKDFPQGKRRTAPYLIGELAKKYADERQVYQAFQLTAWPRRWDE